MQPRLTGTGDKVLQAERKNRVERGRLDLQLKIYDREKLLIWGFVEKEKRMILANMDSMKRTTGVSEKGIAPTEHRDNVYDMSLHTRNRISEKRLMEWKVVEKQLQRFLKAKAVPMDDISSANTLGTTILWDGDTKKKKRKKMSGTAWNKMGGDVEEEKLAVQQRVSNFLHHGLHSTGAAGGDSQKIPRTKSEEKLKRVSSGKSIKSDRSSGRQWYHSEHVVRPHTALGQTVSPPKQSKRPASAFAPTKQQTGITITKDDVYLTSSGTTSKRMLPSTTLDLPLSKVNNFVGGLGSSSAVNSLADRDTVTFKRRQSEMRGYTRLGSSDSEEALSERGSKALTKQVSMSSMVDQLNEQKCPISRSTSAHSSKYSRGSSLSRSRSDHSLRQTDDYSSVTYRLEEIEDVEYADSRMSEDDRRLRDFDYPDMHDTDTVKDTLKFAHAFSKAARKSALESLVELHSPDKRKQLRQERLDAVKTKSALLSEEAGNFNLLE